MAYVYKSTMSQWCDVQCKYEDMFTDYFSSKKKAVDNAVRVIKIMHDDTAEITKGETYTYVTTTNHRASVKGRDNRSYFITQQYVS
jgi:hypothetical protein